MSSLLKNIEYELQFFIELLILAIVGLRNIIKNQVASVKIEQGKRYVEETKLHKLIQIPTMTVKQEQEKGSKIVEVDLKHTNQVRIVKMEQVKQKQRGRFTKSKSER